MDGRDKPGHDEEASHFPPCFHIPISAITALLRRGQRLGLIDKTVNPSHVARMMVSMFQGYALQRVWDEPFKATATLEVFDILLRGLARTAR